MRNAGVGQLDSDLIVLVTVGVIQIVGSGMPGNVNQAARQIVLVGGGIVVKRSGHLTAIGLDGFFLTTDASERQ
jgi:hypothetical protein